MPTNSSDTSCLTSEELELLKRLDDPKLAASLADREYDYAYNNLPSGAVVVRPLGDYAVKIIANCCHLQAHGLQSVTFRQMHEFEDFKKVAALGGLQFLDVTVHNDWDETVTKWG